MRFLGPVLILFGHGVEIIGDEFDTPAKRIGILAENLNSLLHELDVLLGKWLTKRGTGL